jgi:hypothetical protein
VAELLAFIGVAVVVIVTPGQDTALTVRDTLAGGRRAGIRTASGVVCGQAVSALAASAGIAAPARGLRALVHRGEARRRRLSRLPRPPGAAGVAAQFRVTLSSPSTRRREWLAARES